MALAVLCGEYAQTTNLPAPVAFVVDHRAREGSNEEAVWVCDQLKQKIGQFSLDNGTASQCANPLEGITAHILTLDWPEGTNPATVPNFESKARVLRYQALGKACRGFGISSLLLGHHQNDRYETILQRMMMGASRKLIGIDSVKEIPECDGIHGVHESGSIDSHPGLHQKSGIVAESGGVKVLRPLLRFSKDNLLATCVSRDLPWIEDPTNQDRTLTVRNAIRHMVREYRLPVALRERSILAIAESDRELSQKVEKLFDASKIRLDLRSGLLKVEFPRKKFNMDQTKSKDETGFLLASLLGRMTRLVSPFRTLELGKLGEVVDAIFRGSENYGQHTPSSGTKEGGYTAQGIYFQPLGDSGREWFLSRQNIMPMSCLQQPIPFEIKPNNYPRPIERVLTKLVLDIPACPPSTSVYDTPFHLFDNRFWIRIWNVSPLNVRIRTPTIPDFQAIRSYLSHSLRRDFDKRLQEAAPGSVRYTLPLIEIRSDNGPGRLLVLPTFQISASIDMATLAPEQTAQFREVQWECRYRKVDLGHHNPENVLVGGYMLTGN